MRVIGYGRVPTGDPAQDGVSLDAQEAIALVRALCGAGHSLCAIVRALEAEGYRTRTGRARWHPKTVAAIVARERMAA